MNLGKMFRGCPLFREIYDEEIEWLVKDCSIHYFRPGDFILREGDKEDSLLIILEGEAKMSKTISGKSFDLQVLRNGDLMGEKALMEEKISETEVQAQKKTSILKVPFETLMNTFNSRPEVYGLLLTNLYRMVLKNAQVSQEVIFRFQREGKIVVRTPLYGQERRKKWNDEGKE